MQLSVSSALQITESIRTLDVMLNVIRNPLNSSVLVLRLLGDCCKVQKNEQEKKLSIMLQDCTGFAIVHLLVHLLDTPKDIDPENEPEKWYGSTLLEDPFSSHVIEVAGLDVVSATMYFKDIKIEGVNHKLLGRHLRVVKRTKDEDFLFVPPEKPARDI
ncbi:hypothetical protein FGB62_57g011 [Gracilaria domingensis]|nr:hypothetical protein FGB62_57g011 [Gracilaria domingensis]